MRKGLLMRRTASFTLIALATFAGGSTAAVAAPAGPDRAGVVSLQRAPMTAAGHTGRMTTGIAAWRPIKGACIICWNPGR